MLYYATITPIDYTLTETINLSCPEAVCPTITCDYECPDCLCKAEKVPIFVQEARTVAQANDWKEDRYMCCDFSIELWRRLTNDGYEAEICYGEYTPTGEEHCWVKLEGGILIEATTGEFVLPKDENRYMENQCDNEVTPAIKAWVGSYHRGETWYE